jgi:pyridoxamine 5'-phosphate oxidase
MLLDGRADPMALFLDLYARAQAEEPFDATACALATASRGGQPAVRMVLLKGTDPRGFVFFTNYESRKGRELTENPKAALCFHWPRLAIQVRVEGSVERTSQEESDAYFATRPRGSQLGAWASEQSRPLSARSELLDRVNAMEARFGGGAVPRPAHWGGFRLLPSAIEFWAGQSDRLHDRIRYERAESEPGGWRAGRLFP